MLLVSAHARNRIDCKPFLHKCQHRYICKGYVANEPIGREYSTNWYCSNNGSSGKCVLTNEEIFGDKAYQRPDAKEVEEKQNLKVLTPVKKDKGQKYLAVDEQWLSTAVSRVRQPIETLFGWIEEKTSIEFAGKVRSYQWLMVHVFERIAAAMFFWNKLRVSHYSHLIMNT